MVRLTQVTPALVTVFLAVQGALSTPSAAPNADVVEYTRSIIESGLTRRQINAPSLSGSDASQCESQCQPLTGLESCTGTDLSCYCNDKISNAFASCFDCALAIDTNLTMSQAQTAYDGYVSGCKSAGFSVPSQTLKASTKGGSGAGTVKAGVFGISVAVAAAALALVA